MERLSGLDASFLYLETPNAHMHVGSAVVFEPDGGFSFGDVKDAVAARLHLLPPFRRRLVTVPFGLHHPVWVDDPHFDLDNHIRRAALPSPGGREELADLAAEIMGRPLDRRRPLWEMWVVEGVEGGRVASITKTHHAAIDGVSGVELTGALLDTEPDSAIDPDGYDFRPEPIPDEPEMLVRALADLARQPVRAARVAARTAKVVGRLALRNLPDGGTTPRPRRSDPPPAPFTAPHTPLNTAITPHRRVGFTSLPLAEVKAVKDAAGVKLNDVVLAICAHGLRAYLQDRGELPDSPLVAFVPISVRDDGGEQAGGNQVSAMLASLATDSDDPLERLERIAGSASGGKSQHEQIGAATLTDWTEFAAPALFSRAARLYSRTRMADRHRPLFNLVISNIPGPQVPLYFAGHRMTAMYPMGPPIEGGALNITVMSYDGGLYVGLVGGREAVPDIGRIGAGIEDGLTALRKALDVA